MDPKLPLSLFLAAIAVRTGLILVVVLIAFRLLGKRPLGGLDMLDILVVLLVANGVQNAITNGSGRFTVGIVSAATLIVLDRVFGFWSTRHPLFERKVAGNPVLLGRDGKLDRRVLRRQGVTEEEVRKAARSFGIADLKDMKYAILEVDGSISVIKKSNLEGAQE